MKQKHFIDSHKAVTFVVVLILMAVYNQWDNPTAWVYLALHGTYGLMWNLKSRIFPDQSWERPTGILYGLVIWGSLSLYWIAPWLLTWRGVQVPLWYMAICISLYTFGVFMHFASDMQKYVNLKSHPDKLFCDGLWTHIRNPNYFGELLIYSGFGLLARHWLAIVVILLWIISFWLPNMLRKDRILSQLDGFKEYKAHSKLFIPFVF